jgi:hypothetical protein
MPTEEQPSLENTLLLACLSGQTAAQIAQKMLPQIAENAARLTSFTQANLLPDEIRPAQAGALAVGHPVEAQGFLVTDESTFEQIGMCNTHYPPVRQFGKNIGRWRLSSGQRS